MRAARWLGAMGATLAALISEVSCSCQLNDYCNRDLDCPRGQVCNYYNECMVPGCTSDQACGHGNVCTVQYECTPGCRSNEGCDLGSICVSSSDLVNDGPDQCQPGCRSDNECAAGKVCEGTDGCVAGCRSTDDCGPGMFCPLVTSSNGFSLFNTGTSTCQTGCHDDGECRSSELCDDGTCFPRCSDQLVCAHGMACVALHSIGTFRIAPDGTPIACGAGERCRCWSSDSTEGTCDIDLQCQSGYVCSAQRCVIPTPSSDAGVVHADAGGTSDAGDSGDANDAGDGRRDGATDAKTSHDAGAPDSGRSNP